MKEGRLRDWLSRCTDTRGKGVHEGVGSELV